MLIGDYIISQLLYESSHTSIYRAFRKKDELVILKLLKSEYRLEGEIEKLKHEFEILQKINSSRVIKAYNFEKIDNIYILVEENFDGGSLESIRKEAALSIKVKLKISIEIALALADIHQQHIIHKDIKPQNILVNLADSTIKLIDFGLSSQLSREITQVVKPSWLSGTLAYISPEQTGRMNRSLDFRTDIYSFGITLYQLFTNKLPFEAESDLALIHSHVAKAATPPSKINENIPDVISEIIMKCISKEADDRYQSALGLKNDLEKCLQMIEKTGMVSPFAIGQKDFHARFQIPSKMHGRKNELNSLLTSFNNISQGRREVVMIAGPEGIGKSSLISELQKTIIKNNGNFISGSFDAYKKNIPFHGLIDALQMLIDQILAENEENLKLWKDKIIQAVGINGSMLADLLPRIELIIGEPARAPVLSNPMNAENRRNYVLMHFLEIFLDQQNPLVLFLDDLQWVDKYTLDFIEYFLMHSDSPFFLLLGAYQNNKVNEHHSLSLAIDDFRNSNIPVQIIELPPLELDAVSSIVKDTLKCSEERALVLAKLLVQKTHGNPFYINTFLKELYQKGFFEFDANAHQWNFDLGRIEKEPIAENVAEFMSRKIQELPFNTQITLKVGSAIGKSFDLKTIAHIRNIPLAEADRDILPALESEFILKNNDVSEEGSQEFYTFQHEKIKQGAAKLITEEEKKSLHIRIGQVLLSEASEKTIGNKILEIVDHFNEGTDLMEDAEDRQLLAKLNLVAGRKANELAAFELSLAYFNKGIGLLTEDSWETNHDLSYSLYSNTILGELIFGDQDKAEFLFDFALKKIKTDTQKGNLYAQIIYLYGQRGQYQKALDAAVKGLLLFGIKLDLDPSKASVKIKYIKLKCLLFFKNIEDLPDAKNERIMVICGIYAAILQSAFRQKEFLHPYTALELMELTLKHGMSEFGIIAFAAYAWIQSSFFLREYEYGYKFAEEVLKLIKIKRYPLSRIIINATRYVYIFAWRWGRPLSSLEEPIKDLTRLESEFGNFGNVALLHVYSMIYKICSGQSLNGILKKLELLCHELYHFPKKGELYLILIMRSLCQVLRDPAQDISKDLSLIPTSDDAFNAKYEEIIKEKHFDNYGMFFQNIWHLYGLYLNDQYEKALALAEQILPHCYLYINHPLWNVFYFYYALTLTALKLKYQKKMHRLYTKSKALEIQPFEEEKEPSEAVQKISLAEINTYHQMLLQWSQASPLNYRHQYLLLSAEIEQLQGNHQKSIDLYEEAIETAKKNGFMHEEALACERLGKLYVEINKEKLGSFFLNEACSLYNSWGAQRLVNKLQQQYYTLFSKLKSKLSLGDTYDMMSSEETISNPSQSLDINTIVEASRVLSKQVKLEKLIEALMRVVMVNAGASKVFLILPEHDSWKIYAELQDQQQSILQENLKLDDKKDQLCRAAVQYVIRTKEMLLLNDAINEGKFTSDSYILTSKPQSIAILPLIQQEKLAGVLYLENALLKGAFSHDRIHFLSILSTQMAISIENSKLYSAMAEKIEERTHEINEKNEKLKQAVEDLTKIQNELIQKEKLAAIGLMTSGVAHELNNPLNLVINYAEISNEHAHKLLKKMSAEELSKKEIEDSLANIAKMLDKIDQHSKRAHSIIQRMLVHAYQGNQAAQNDDINKVIEKAVQYVLETFYKKEPNFNLEMIKNLDLSIPQIPLYSADIMRVFINLLENACYALVEKRKKEDFKPRLSIETKALDSVVQITIRDNGMGIKEGDLSKLFQPFFTTKPAGSGTGLGLFLCYDIVTQQHAGTIELRSEFGSYTEAIIKLPKKKS